MTIVGDADHFSPECDLRTGREVCWVGQGFIPGIKPGEGTAALAPEVCFSGCLNKSIPESKIRNKPEGERCLSRLRAERLKFSCLNRLY